MTCEVAVPSTVAEACSLARQEGSVLMAGGTDVLVWAKSDRIDARRIVLLSGLDELRQCYWENERTFRLGACVTHEAVASDPILRERFPALVAACASVGAWATRTAGTVGGNICTAAPSADSAGPLLVYGARVLVSDGQRERVVPLRSFITGPGQTGLGPGEIVLAILLDNPGSHGWSFVKHGRRMAVDLALVSVTVALWADSSGEVQDLRVALGAVAPTPMLVEGLDPLVVGKVLGPDLVELVAEEAASQCRPITDIRASREYRRHAVKVLTRRALQEALGRLRGAEDLA